MKRSSIVLLVSAGAILALAVVFAAVAWTAIRQLL